MREQNSDLKLDQIFEVEKYNNPEGKEVSSNTLTFG